MPAPALRAATRAVYRTVQGDTFDSIAYRLYGDEHLCHELMLCNPAHMDVLVFEAGVELALPYASQETPRRAIAAARRAAAVLPAWYA